MRQGGRKDAARKTNGAPDGEAHSIADCDAQRFVDAHQRSRSQRVENCRTVVSWPHRSSRRRRSAWRENIACRSANRPSRPDDFSLRRFGQDMERGCEAAGVRIRQRTRRRSHVLAHTRTRVGARQLVCGHFTAGLVSLGGRRRDMGRRRRLQSASAAQGMVRRRSGRPARWSNAAFDSRRSARCRASLYCDVVGRRVRVG